MHWYFHIASPWWIDGSPMLSLLVSHKIVCVYVTYFQRSTTFLFFTSCLLFSNIYFIFLYFLSRLRQRVAKMALTEITQVSDPLLPSKPYSLAASGQLKIRTLKKMKVFIPQSSVKV